jgi:hypothetical protein
LVDGKSFVLNALKYFGISRLSVSKVEVLKGSMEGRYLVITCTLTMNDTEIPTHALINWGATGIAFMDQDFAHHHQIPLQEVQKRKHLNVLDIRPIESGHMMHIAKVGMNIQDHGE